METVIKLTPMDRIKEFLKLFFEEQWGLKVLKIELFHADADGKKTTPDKGHTQSILMQIKRTKLQQFICDRLEIEMDLRIDEQGGYTAQYFNLWYVTGPRERHAIPIPIKHFQFDIVGNIVDIKITKKLEN